MSSILILKASKDICGNEIGLISSHCSLLKMKVYTENILSEGSLNRIVNKYLKTKTKFDYVYLCTHGNINGFTVNIGSGRKFIKWSRFSQLFSNLNTHFSYAVEIRH